MDVAASIFNASNEHVEDVYFAHKSGFGDAVSLSPDRAPDKTTFHLDLAALSSTVHTIVFSISVWSHAVDHTQVKNAYFRLFADGKEELCSFWQPGALESNSLVLCALSRNDRGAKMLWCGTFSFALLRWLSVHASKVLRISNIVCRSVQPLGLGASGRTVRVLRSKLRTLLECGALAYLSNSSVNA